MAYVRIALQETIFVDLLVEHFKNNHENPKCTSFSFIILNSARKVILHFHVTTATDVFFSEYYQSKFNNNCNLIIFAIDFYAVGMRIRWGLFWCLLLLAKKKSII